MKNFLLSALFLTSLYAKEFGIKMKSMSYEPKLLSSSVGEN